MAEGYTVHGECHRLQDSLCGRVAMVCGNAYTVYEDLDSALENVERPVIFAANDIGMYLPVVHHWASLHADKLREWAAVRRCEPSLWQDFTTHTTVSALRGADNVWAIEPCAFSLSGMFTMQVAYLMGADRIILCGCPGDQTRRFFDKHSRIDYAYGGGDSAGDQRDHQQLMNEINRVPELKRRVRSMSGRTQEIFGGL